MLISKINLSFYVEWMLSNDTKLISYDKNSAILTSKCVFTLVVIIREEDIRFKYTLQHVRVK